MTDIVVEVSKGMVTGLYCDLKDARFVVVDWDLIERADSQGQAGIEHDHSKLTRLPANTRKQFHQAISE